MASKPNLALFFCFKPSNYIHRRYQIPFFQVSDGGSMCVFSCWTCTHICIQCICTQIHIWLWVKIVSGLFCSDPDSLNRGAQFRSGTRVCIRRSICDPWRFNLTQSYGKTLRFADSQRASGQAKMQWWWWWWWWCWWWWWLWFWYLLETLLETRMIVWLIVPWGRGTLISSWNPIRNPNDCMDCFILYVEATCSSYMIYRSNMFWLTP